MTRKGYSKLWLCTGSVVMAGLAMRADAAPTAYTDTHSDQIGSANKLRDLWSASIDDDGSTLYFTFNIDAAGNLATGGAFNYGIGITSGNPTAGGDTSANATTHGNAYNRAISIDSSLGGMMEWVGLFGAGGGGSVASPYTGYGYNDFTFGTPGSSKPAGVWTQVNGAGTGVVMGKPTGSTGPTQITLAVSVADFASNLTLAPGGTFKFDIYSTGTGAGQTAYDSLVDPTPTVATATTQYNGTALNTYTLHSSATPLSLVWNNASGGGDGATWDIAQNGVAGGTINQNWLDATQPFFFFQNNAVTFNDSNNSHYAVTLNTAVRPASVTVDNSLGNYTISGTGSITGTGGLTKTGTSSLTLSTANTYSGLTTVSAGTVIATNNSSLGSATAATAGLLLNPSSGTATVQFTSAAPSIASLASSGAGTSSIVLGNATAGTATALSIGANGASTTFGGVISDMTGTNAAAIGSLNKVGSGTLTLTGTNTYTGTTTVSAGTLRVDANQGGSILTSLPLILSGGTFSALGKSGAVTNLTVGGLTLNAGTGSGFAIDGGNSTSTTMNISGPISATAPGTSLDISTATSGTTTASVTTTQANTNGILSGRITFNGTDFAANGATPGTSPIGAPTYSAISTSGGTDTNNSLVTDSATLGAGTTTTNSLKVTDTQAGQSLNVGGGNTLSLTSGGLLFTGANDYTIAGGTLTSGMANPSDLIVHQYGSGTLTINSTIADGNGTSTLTKAGPGTLVLGGANTYTGITYVNNGTLALTGTNASSSYLVNNSTLSLRNAGSISSGGVTLSGSGVLNETTANALSGTATVTLSSGTPSVLLSQPNTYSGNTTINAGTLQLGDLNAAQNSTINLNVAGGLTFATGVGTVKIGGLVTTQNIVLNDNAAGAVTIQLANTASNTLTGVFSGSGGLTELGPGATTLSAANTYTGLTTVTGGTINATNNASLGNTTAATTGLLMNPASGTATVNFTSSNPNIGSLASSGAGTSSIVLGSINGTTATATTLSVGFNNAASTTFAGLISDLSGTNAAAKGNLTKVGLGSLTLTNANTYTGTTSLNGGTLVVGNPLALGPVNAANPAQLVTSPSSTITQIVTLDLATDMSVGAYNMNEGFGGNTIIQSDKATPNSPGILHTLGTLSYGAATLTTAAGPNVLGGAPAVAFGNTILNSHTTGNTTIFNPTTASMNILGNVTSMANTGATVTLQLDGTNSGNTITGVISDNAAGGMTAVTKSSTSNWTLSGASTYTGSTAVNGGTLTIDTAGSIASPFVTVASTATLAVKGGLISPFGTNVTSAGTVTFAGNTQPSSSTVLLGSVTISSGGTVHLLASPNWSSPLVFSPTSLIIPPFDSTATLDLGDNELQMNETLGNIRAEILAGSIKTTGQVNGHSLAVGSLDLGGGQIEARATLLGDSDLDGQVNVADLANLAGNFGVTTGMTWLQGDFDYNDNVNVADLADLAGNFGGSIVNGTGTAVGSAAAPASLAAGAAAVPEPASLGLIGFGAIRLLSRRTRRRRTD
jgi:autotransporter-associated beta strand protein